MKDLNELKEEWGKYGIQISPVDARMAFDSFQVGKFWAAVQNDRVIAYMPVWVDSKGDYAAYREKAIACLSAIENTQLELGVMYRDLRGEQYFVVRNSRVMKALKRKDDGKPTDLQTTLQILSPIETETFNKKMVLDWAGVHLIYVADAFAVLRPGLDDKASNYVTIPFQLAEDAIFLNSVKDCLSPLGDVVRGKLYQTFEGLRYFAPVERAQEEYGLKQMMSVGENSLVQDCLRHRFRAVKSHIQQRLFAPERLGREFLPREYSDNRIIESTNSV